METSAIARFVYGMPTMDNLFLPLEKFLIYDQIKPLKSRFNFPLMEKFL
jgi:hypothetical protein